MRGVSGWPGVLPLLLAAGGCGSGDLTLPGPGAPASLTIIAGDGQRGPQGQPLADPLVVQVQDGEGRPVAGTSVAFRFTDELPGAQVDPGAAPTDADGHATARAQLGRRSGSQPVEAEVAVPGQDLRVRFQLTAVAPTTDPPGGDGAGDDSGGGAGSGDEPSSPPPAPPPPPAGGGGDGGHGHGHHRGHGDGNGHEDKDH
jgi:hypothetical protein